MKLSKIFTKTRKDAPSDEQAKNAQLLIRAGYIHKEMAGVYSYMPLGWMVLNNIIQIISEEMNAIGGLELQMSGLQDPKLWQKTDEWNDEVVDVWFKSKLKNDQDIGFGYTHEAALANAMAHYVGSYKDLPFLAYQFQTKFRNEVRAKSGVMRTREFIMKDLYSFARSDQEHQEIYDKVKDSYVKIFDRLGIGDKTYMTYASGGSFSEFSHEFQTLADAGEDEVYLDEANSLAINKEVFNQKVLDQLSAKREQFTPHKMAEVGNIFSLGTKYSDAHGLMFTDKDGSHKPVVMGSYGIGPARVMGVIVEQMSDDMGLVWPKEIAPAQVLIVPIGNDKDVQATAESIYKEIEKQGVRALLDDRDVSPGQALADSELLGVPARIVVSNKTLAEDKVELMDRKSLKTKLLSAELAVKELSI